MRDDLQLRSESNQPPSGIFMVASLATARNKVGAVRRKDFLHVKSLAAFLFAHGH